jgi:hypothetical protein
VLTYVTGGCHIWEYLLEGSHVTAADEDIYQIALLELKKVSILHLPFDQFFDIFGQSNTKLLQSVYACSLRAHLTNESAIYWDTELPKVSSFMYSHGSGGRLSWFLFQLLLSFVGLGFIKSDLQAGVSASALRKRLQGYKFRLQTLAYLVDSVVYRFGLCFPSVVVGSQASLGEREKEREIDR